MIRVEGLGHSQDPIVNKARRLREAALAKQGRTPATPNTGEAATSSSHPPHGEPQTAAAATSAQQAEVEGSPTADPASTGESEETWHVVDPAPEDAASTAQSSHEPAVSYYPKPKSQTQQQQTAPAVQPRPQTSHNSGTTAASHAGDGNTANPYAGLHDGRTLRRSQGKPLATAHSRFQLVGSPTSSDPPRRTTARWKADTQTDQAQRRKQQQQQASAAAGGNDHYHDLHHHHHGTDNPP